MCELKTFAPSKREIRETPCLDVTAAHKNWCLNDKNECLVQVAYTAAATATFTDDICERQMATQRNDLLRSEFDALH